MILLFNHRIMSIPRCYLLIKNYSKSLIKKPFQILTLAPWPTYQKIFHPPSKHHSLTLNWICMLSLEVGNSTLNIFLFWLLNCSAQAISRITKIRYYSSPFHFICLFSLCIQSSSYHPTNISIFIKDMFKIYDFFLHILWMLKLLSCNYFYV